jgi:polar amino acid transport system permease protein
LVVSLAAAHKIDLAFIQAQAPFILAAAPLTILISAVSIAIAIVFAVLGAFGRISRVPPIYAVATLYVSLVRGTPLIVQLLFIYLALPQFGIVIPALPTGILALAFNYGAYMTEIFRAGIQAVPRGQLDAAHALGMTDRDTMRRIVLPQALRIVTPAIGNEFIAMIKDSALVSIVGVQEMLFFARIIGSQKFRTFETFIIAALVYWILTILFTFFQERLERRLAQSDRRA